MRYYDLTLQDASTGKTVWHYSSLIPGTNQNNPSALNIEFDITIVNYTAAQGAWIKVWGIPITDIQNSTRFNGTTLTLYGGMSKGLPLASPAQAGLLVKGTVFQAVGNWQGTAMTLEFYVQALSMTTLVADQRQQSANIVLMWKQGQTLASALAITLATAFPNMQQDIKISPNLLLGYDEQAVFQNLPQLATWLLDQSQTIINSNSYMGVTITPQNGIFIVRDGTVSTPPKTIAFNDLIGQITLDTIASVNVTCVLRGDLSTGGYISIPPGQVITSQSSYSQYRQGPIFTGVYYVDSLRHVGNLRQTDAESWVTVIHAIGPQAASVAA